VESKGYTYYQVVWSHAKYNSTLLRMDTKATGICRAKNREE
jgi:hypothetical protein